MSTKIIIEATRLVAIEELDYDDRRDGKDLVQGVYVVDVEEDSQDPEEKALDIFHSSVPVACLEHYNFEARRPTPEDDARTDLIEVKPFDPDEYIRALDAQIG
jgi:hypothetical protein